MQCKTQSLHPPAVEELVRNKIGSAFITNYNDDKTLGLYFQEFPAQQQGTHKVKFVVVDLNSRKILKEGSYLNGHVKWRDNTSLEVLDVPGVIKKDQSTSDFKKVIYLKNNTPEKP